MNFEGLNEQQFEAITSTFDASVDPITGEDSTKTAVIAGAGSGKTRVLTERISYLIDGLEVPPKNIMAVTFTRKAANEMAERISNNVGYTNGLWLGTFHSICIQILKKYGYLIDIDKKFKVLDEFKSRNMIMEILKKNQLDYSKSEIDYYINYISNNQSCSKGAKRKMNDATNDMQVLDARIYAIYINECRQRNTFDYDQLITYATLLLQDHKYVRDELDIKYLLVDEYQDVNKAQYLLIKNLITDNNLFVVGDYKQCIYGFRCSTPEFLERFESMFENTRIIYLDRNYRSTKNIVNASNSLIKRNPSKFDVNCFTEGEDGSPIFIHECEDVYDEALYVTNQIIKKKQLGTDYSDIAILFRNNSQSVFIEEQLMKNKIPYYIYSGFSYFERAEVKDILSFIKFSDNTFDKESFVRAFGCFDGIGKKVLDEVVQISDHNGVNYYTGFMAYIEKRKSEMKTKNSATITKLENAIKIFEDIYSYDYLKLGDLISFIYTSIKYEDILKKNYEKKGNDEKQKILSKISNIEELINISNNLHEKNPNITTEEFIKTTVNTQNEDLDDGKVKLISIHSSKGLEFKHVYVCGVEKNILPSFLAAEPKEVEEERRLFYVAMTRAKEELTITHCKYRIRNEITYCSSKSTFIDEIDEQYIQLV